jgi:hypothetical protein
MPSLCQYSLMIRHQSSGPSDWRPPMTEGLFSPSGLEVVAEAEAVPDLVLPHHDPGPVDVDAGPAVVGVTTRAGGDHGALARTEKMSVRLLVSPVLARAKKARKSSPIVARPS